MSSMNKFLRHMLLDSIDVDVQLSSKLESAVWPFTDTNMRGNIRPRVLNLLHTSDQIQRTIETCGITCSEQLLRIRPYLPVAA
ncbi:hypothetical protein D3C81_1769330 [compost metagenome]